MKKYLLFFFIFFILTTRIIAEENPLKIGCDLLLDAKDDQSHITNSLRYLQKKIDENNIDIAIFLIHSFGDLKVLKKVNDCFYNSNRILGTNHDAAFQILIKKFPYIKKYEFRTIYNQFYQYKNQNNEIIKKIQESSLLSKVPFSYTSKENLLADELINYYLSLLESKYNEIENSLANLCFFEKNILKKIEYCTKSAEEDDLFASAYLGKMYLYGSEDQNNKGYFLRNSKNLKLSEKYISQTNKLMKSLIKSSPDRDDKFNNWAKDFYDYEIFKIYKRAINGDAEAQYQMGILSITEYDPRRYNIAAFLERFFGSSILENKIKLKEKYIPNCVQATNWFEKSVKQNFAPALYILHEIYSNDYKNYDHEKNFYKYFFDKINSFITDTNINKQKIGEFCVKAKNEARVANGYDLLVKAADNNEYRAQCKLGLFYAFTDDKEIRNLELGFTYILLSQQPREQYLYRDDGYRRNLHYLWKKGFDKKYRERCGKGDHKYLFPEQPYYDQAIDFDEISNYADFLNGKILNKNSSFYKRLIQENKILSDERLKKLLN